MKARQLKINCNKVMPAINIKCTKSMTAVKYKDVSINAQQT